MEKLVIDLKKFMSVSLGVSIDSQRYVLNGVFIGDFEEDGNNYRYYTATDGRICLFYKTKIEKTEIKDGIILINSNNNLKISKKQWNDLKTCDFESEFIKVKNKYVSEFGNLDIIDGVYPNFRQLFKYEEFKKVDFYYLISLKYHTMLNKFWSYDSTLREQETKIFEKQFYCNKKSTQANTPLFNFEFLDKNNTLKCSLVMPLSRDIEDDITQTDNFKSFNITKQVK